MKTIVSINAVNWGSTGNIMIHISDTASLYGHKTYVAYGDCRRARKRKVENSIIIGNRFMRNISMRLGRVLGCIDQCVPMETYRFLKKLDKLNPDLIHLHNLHGSFIHVGMLFKYLKKKNIPVVWTLHDCWAITGQCPHFTLAQCEKWKKECCQCNQYWKYPKTYFDNTKYMHRKKKEWFGGLERMIIVTPSKWLEGVIAHSFLNSYDAKVINNGIDLNHFKYVESDFLDKYHLCDKQIILGVADVWGERKGLNDFVELSKVLEKNQHIVLVGLNDKQIQEISSDNILALPHTQSLEELVEIYSSATILFNPTYEDNFPTVNIEAQACGTPVITYNTGGSPEMLRDNTGKVVIHKEYTVVLEFLQCVTEAREQYRAACIKNAKNYCMEDRFKEYINLYDELFEYI